MNKFNMSDLKSLSFGLVSWLPDYTDYGIFEGLCNGLSSEYFVGLGTGFFSTLILAGLFFYYFKRPKPGGGGPIGGQDACIQPFAPTYSNQIEESKELPVFVGLNRDDYFLDWHDSEESIQSPINTIKDPRVDNGIVNRLLRRRREDYGAQTDKELENRGTCTIVPDVTKEFGIQTVECTVIERLTQDVSIQLELPAYKDANVVVFL